MIFTGRGHSQNRTEQAVKFGRPITAEEWDLYYGDLMVPPRKYNAPYADMFTEPVMHGPVKIIMKDGKYV